MQTELSSVADNTGEETEPCLQGMLVQETSAGNIGTGTRWLLFIPPEIVESLLCFALCLEPISRNNHCS